MDSVEPDSDDVAAESSAAAASTSKAAEAIPAAPPQPDPFPATNLEEVVTTRMRGVVEDFQEQILSSKSRLEPRGLVNTGNLCFMNSILQVGTCLRRHEVARYSKTGPRNCHKRALYLKSISVLELCVPDP